LFWSVVKVAKSELCPAYSWFFASTLFSLSTPILVNRFVTMIGVGINHTNLNEALATGVLLGFCGFIAGLCLQHYFLHALGAHQIVTNILNKKIFRHSLKLTMNARGQKQRVGLARATLCDFQLILLDDPLSAVDVDTEKLLCERLLFGEWIEYKEICVTDF
jgi:ABC-type multidrug transport system fused ATPase/permease subunit